MSETINPYALGEGEHSELTFRKSIRGMAATALRTVLRRGKEGTFDSRPESVVSNELDSELEINREAASALGRQLHEQLVKRERVPYLDAGDPEAQSIIAQLQAIGVALDAGSDEAPYRRGKRVSDQEALRYLDKKRFVDTSIFPAGDMLEIESEHLDIGVPLSVFTDAAGFDSWRGRALEGGRSYKKYHKENGDGSIEEVWGTSLEAMKYYASLPTPVPPVARAIIYVQPDGQVFGDNGTGDSHRIGAAYLKGDEVIATDKLGIIWLDENLVPA